MITKSLPAQKLIYSLKVSIHIHNFIFSTNTKTLLLIVLLATVLVGCKI